MSNEKKLHVIQVSAEIAQLQARLATKMAELDALLAPPEPVKPKGAHFMAGKARPVVVHRTRQTGGTADVTESVSAKVLGYLKTKRLGRSAIEVIEDLGLRDRADAVRSALKKHASAGRLVNTSGVWSWVPPPGQRQNETAPVVRTEADLRRLSAEEAERATITYPT